MPKRSYSDEEKANALLALDANGGNVLKTARLIGIPRDTLADWHRGKVNPAVLELQQGKRPPLAERFEEIAHRALDLLPGKMGEATTRDLAVVAAISIDKARLLREQPTTITREQVTTDAERADRILELLGSRGESGTRPPAQPPAVLN